jgi:uncharacterized membrane protein (UPF0136 family)
MRCSDWNAGLLLFQFALRTHESRKIMPSGLLMMISLAAFISLAVFASQASSQ